jgi:prevent-host-death family protein
MITVTAAEAGRCFVRLLDAVEQGETVIITRDGVPVGRLIPEQRTSADGLKAALRKHPADAGFAEDLDAAHASLRSAFSNEEDLSAEPDAWEYDANGAIRIVGTDVTVAPRQPGHT